MKNHRRPGPIVFLVAFGFLFASTPPEVSAQGFVTNSRLQLGSGTEKSASVRLADLDNDRDLDIVVANGRHWPQPNFAYLNDGKARFSVMRPIGSDRLTTYACELADLDGDGDLDIATGNDMAPCQIFTNNGKGNFQLSGTFGEVSSVRSLTLSDIDQDGDTDILVTCRGRSNFICLNDGQATFDSKVEFGTQTDSTIDVAVGDVNSDGHLDLVLANRDGQPNAWLLNDGQLKFTQTRTFGAPGSQTRAISVGDFNLDGKLDWATGNIGQPNRVYLGDGNSGVLKEIEFGSPTSATYCLTSADIDRDGDLDLIVGNVRQANAVFLNNGLATEFNALSFGNPAHATYGLSVSDVNGDQMPDIVVANSDAVNRVFINRLTRTATRTRTNGNSNSSIETGKSTTGPAKPSGGSDESTRSRPAYSPTDWPAFRGTGGRGVSEGYPLPWRWNADPTSDSQENILWETRVPGLGHSSPVVFGDKIFLLTAVPSDGDAPLNIAAGGKPTAADDNGTQEWLLLCYEKTSGRELWRKIVRKGKPRATRHAKATHANTSVCVSGDSVVLFLGSEGLYCYNLDGELRWKQDLGVIDISKYGIGWGFASSPVVHNGRILIVCDDPKNPFVAARSLSDGAELWRTSRKGICERSWGTPLVYADNNNEQVVVNGWPWIVSYDLSNGNEIWRLKGGGDNPVPTPFEANGMLFITNAHGGPSPIYAVDPRATGDISPAEDKQLKPGIIWHIEKGGSYMSTPVVYKNQVYVGDSRGIIRSFDATNGSRIFQARLDRNAGVISSLVAGDGKIYLPSENGNVYVVEHGRELKILSKNEMGEPCLATPALSAGVLYLRTTKRLVAVKTGDQSPTEEANPTGN